MKEKVDFCLSVRKDHVQDKTISNKAVNTDFVSYLRLTVGNSPLVAQDLAYCMTNILNKWPIKFPNANRLRDLAMHVLDADYSRSYQKKAMIAIERYAQFLNIDGVHLKKPKQKQKEISYLTIEEMSRLIKAAQNQRDFTILVLFCKTGMRAQELLDLNIGDINFERREIIVRHGKGDKARMIDFDEQTDRVLRTYLGMTKRGVNSSLFVSRERNKYRESNRLGYKALFTMVRNTGKKVGLTVHPHMLRHSFACAWVANESDVFNLQTVLGHTDIAMTRRYWHSCPETRKIAYNKGVAQL